MNTIPTLFPSSIRPSSMNEIQIKEEEIYHDYQEDIITEKYLLEEPKEIKATEEIKATDTNAIKLCSTSKEISKDNAERFVKFFEMWTSLKKSDTKFKEKTLNWYSGFKKEQNKTYIYRVFDEIKIHFRLAINEKSYNFDNLIESDWPKLFGNLTDYLIKEIEARKSSISTGKKSIVLNVWIDSLDNFRIDAKPTSSKEPAFQDSNLEEEHKEPKKQKKSKSPKENRAIEVDKKSSLARKNCLRYDKKDSEDSKGISGKSTSSIRIKKTSHEEKHTRVDETISESAKEHLKRTPSSHHHKKIDHSEKLWEDVAKKNQKKFEREGGRNSFREFPISSSSSNEDDDKASATSVELEDISEELEILSNSIKKKVCKLKEAKNQFQKELGEAREEIRVLRQEILVHIPGDSTEIKNAWLLAAQDKVTKYDKTMQLLRREKGEIQEPDFVQSISSLIADFHSSERRNEEALQELEQTFTKLKKVNKTSK